MNPFALLHGKCELSYVSVSSCNFFSYTLGCRRSPL